MDCTDVSCYSVHVFHDEHENINPGRENSRLECRNDSVHIVEIVGMPQSDILQRCVRVSI